MTNINMPHLKLLQLHLQCQHKIHDPPPPLKTFIEIHHIPSIYTYFYTIDYFIFQVTLISSTI